MRILIVEDGKRLAQALQHILKENGHHADYVCDGMDGLHYATHASYEVVILDVMLPGMSSFDVVKSMRRQGAMTFENLEAYDLSLSLEKHVLTCGEKSIILSNKEFALMRLLASNAGQVVPKIELKRI